MKREAECLVHPLNIGETMSALWQKQVWTVV